MRRLISPFFWALILLAVPAPGSAAPPTEPKLHIAYDNCTVPPDGGDLCEAAVLIEPVPRTGSDSNELVRCVAMVRLFQGGVSGSSKLDCRRFSLGYGGDYRLEVAEHAASPANVATYWYMRFDGPGPRIRYCKVYAPAHSPNEPRGDCTEWKAIP